MKGDKTVIQQLNKVLTYELTSINQFFLHARMFGNWGFEELNEKAYKKSIKDMKQADKLIERILFLEGLPNLQQLDRLRIGETPVEMLTADKGFVADQLPLLKQAISECERLQDYVSRELLEELLEYEENHLDWLETQLQLIDSIGTENYLQSMT
ncbi:MAG: bacterioferritin [Nitrincola lacisaponensis]|uniref:Bacterioferritin n=1 Tax=Nitrincola lacisaponensis TaxID=267850 RepID=A0A063Y2S9_9GAMM|nr:bacterioferritin [Nitrincola lacisaponensis]KDE39959.1 Bacterioferritin [Nitrincola lacisaponensis]